MSTISLARCCWALECQEDGGHQWRTALVVLTLLGAGRAGVVREPKTAGAIANADSPQEVTRAEETSDPEKEWNELHEDMENEEDPRAGMGVDDDEETVPCWRRKRSLGISSRTTAANGILTFPGRKGIVQSLKEAISEIFGQQADLEHVIRHIKGKTNCRGLDRVAHVGWGLESAGHSNFNALCLRQLYRVHCFRVYAVLQARVEASKENDSLPLEAYLNRLARRLLGMTRRGKLGQ